MIRQLLIHVGGGVGGGVLGPGGRGSELGLVAAAGQAQLPQVGQGAVQLEPGPLELPGGLLRVQVAPAAQQVQVEEGGVPLSPGDEFIRHGGGHGDGVAAQGNVMGSHGKTSFVGIGWTPILQQFRGNVKNTRKKQRWF